MFRVENDKKELTSALDRAGIKTATEPLKKLGIETPADLGHLTEAEIKTLSLAPEDKVALQELVKKYRVKTGSSSRRLLAAAAGDGGEGGVVPRRGAVAVAGSEGAVGSMDRTVTHAWQGQQEWQGRGTRKWASGGRRKLLQADAASEDEGEGGGGARRKDDTDVPLDDVQLPEGVDDGRAADGEEAGASETKADGHESSAAKAEPRDGEELVDGEVYAEGNDDDEDDDLYSYYPSPYFHDEARYGADMQYDDDAVASEQAKYYHEQRAEGWRNLPLSHNPESQWGHMKGFFAPEAPDSEDLAFRGEHIQKTILGHDEVFTRMMSIDKDVLLSANRHNKSAPMPGVRPREEGYVYVDPHVLCTPIIADIDR